MNKVRKILVGIILLIFMISAFSNVFAEEKVNMTYLYKGTMNDYKTYINATKDSINVILPNLFNINSDGSLQLTGVINKQFVKDMHNKGIKVIPYISNHWNRELGRKALSNYITYANEVVKIINEYDLDGVNIDIENLTVDDKTDLVVFTQYLRSILPEGKELSMAVAANPNDLKTDWVGSYDYTELDKYLDTFIIMAYDQSYYGSPAGPVASLPFVENSIKTMLKYVDSDKIILGVPFYGRYWNSKESVGGNAITNRLVNSVANTFGATRYYDDYNKTPYLRFTVNHITATYSVGGKKFSVGDYIMYYENDRSLKEKLILVQKYNLKGSASWALSQEDTSIWDNYSNWLNGIYYNDIETSWAKDAIRSVTINGYMNGSSIYEFNPNDYMTREEFATVIYRLMAYDKVVVSGGVFKDVKPNRWSYDYINTLYSYGLVKGNGNYFHPDDYITREEVAAVLYRALKGLNVNKTGTYYDVTSDMWSSQYIEYCAKMGILNGYPDGSFKPKNNITREEIASILDNIIR